MIWVLAAIALDLALLCTVLWALNTTRQRPTGRHARATYQPRHHTRSTP